MWYAIREDELYHHGIKGQKWGVRHGPPYPLKSGGAQKTERGSDRNGSSVSSVAKSIRERKKKSYEYSQKADEHRQNRIDSIAKQKFGKTMAELEADADSENKKWQELDDQLSSHKIDYKEYSSRSNQLYQTSAWKKINEVEDEAEEDTDDTAIKLEEKAYQERKAMIAEAHAFADDFIKRNGHLTVDALKKDSSATADDIEDIIEALSRYGDYYLTDENGFDEYKKWQR